MLCQHSRQSLFTLLYFTNNTINMSLFFFRQAGNDGGAKAPISPHYPPQLHYNPSEDLIHLRNFHLQPNL